MKKNKVLEVMLNPLAFPEIDIPFISQTNDPLNPEAFFSFLCAPGIKNDSKSLIKRYHEINENKKLFAAPVEEHILTKLIWPLRYAKGCYMLGNYLGTIALCGMVAEMITILLFDISDISINDKPLDEDAQVGLFGSRFEKLGQERRISILRTYNLIDDNLKSLFDIIRKKRRLYLHLFSQHHNQLVSDSIEVFNATSEIVVSVIGQNIKGGKLILNPTLQRYLEKKGAFKESDVESE